MRTTEPLPRPIPDAIYLAILEQLRTLRDRALVELMWEGGFRPGEVLGLQLEDVSYGRRRVTVRHRDDDPQHVRQKSRRERVVDLWEERGVCLVTLGSHASARRVPFNAVRRSLSGI